MPGNPLDNFVDERTTEYTLLLNPETDYVQTYNVGCAEFNEIEVISLNEYLSNPYHEIPHNDYARKIHVFEAIVYGFQRHQLPEDTIALVTRFLDHLLNNGIHYCCSNGGTDTMFINPDIHHEDHFVPDGYIVHGNTQIRYNPYLWRDDAIWGYVGDGNMGWFISEEYCFCESNQEYYVDDEVAQSAGVEWRDCCESYHYEDNSCCSRYREGEEGEQFDDSFIDKYNSPTYLQLTKVCGMPYTFGVELETAVSRNVNRNSCINWKAVYDGSTDGLEYVSGVLQGNKGVQTIKDMCEHLNNCDAKVDRKCGVHVHIGDVEFNRRFSIMVLKLCLELESDIYKLLPESRQGNSYCKKLPRKLIDEMNFRNYRETLGEIIQNNIISRVYNKKMHHPGGHYCNQRYYWVNIVNYSTTTGTNTIEFRPHSGSLDFKKIYNWLLICMSIVKFTENKQRRILTSSMSKHPITLNEVLKYSLNQKLYNQVYEYCVSRAKRFGNTLS